MRPAQAQNVNTIKQDGGIYCARHVARKALILTIFGYLLRALLTQSENRP
jgi:hypothetical protein